MEKKTITITEDEYQELRKYKKLAEEKLRDTKSEEFWKLLSREAMKKAWDKEDEIWDKIYKEEVK